jgi:hypothetical protein
MIFGGYDQLNKLPFLPNISAKIIFMVVGKLDMYVIYV